LPFASTVAVTLFWASYSVVETFKSGSVTAVRFPKASYVNVVTLESESVMVATLPVVLYGVKYPENIYE
jgi:hypothetical protein